MQNELLTVTEILEMGFEKLVKEACLEGTVPLLPCPAKIWGKLVSNEGGASVVRFIPNEMRDAYVDVERPRLVMVLESPHKSEYSGKTPIGPAQGKTGENFKRQFFDRFDGASSGAGFLEGMLGARPIIIMNAIEHQCSMGKLSEPEDKRARDLVFRKLWFHHGGSQSFKLRLDALKLDIDDVLVNTCTKGVNKDAKERSWGKPRLLKECVQASIDDFCMTSGLYELRRFQLTHPSSWLGSSQTQ